MKQPDLRVDHSGLLLSFASVGAANPFADASGHWL